MLQMWKKSLENQGGGIQGWESCGKLLIENRICEIQLSRLTSFEYVVQFTQIFELLSYNAVN